MVEPDLQYSPIQVLRRNDYLAHIVPPFVRGGNLAAFGKPQFYDIAVARCANPQPEGPIAFALKVLIFRKKNRTYL
jgi:hypothetical protein